MSIEFGNYLKELRTNKKIEIADLAKKLDTDTSEINSWEDGFVLPSREVIIKIGEVLLISMNEIRNLLKLANYKELTTAEIIAKTPIKPLSFDLSIPEYGEFRKMLLNTSATMGGTISALGGKVDSIENNLKDINIWDTLEEITEDTLSVKEVEAKVEARVAPILRDLQDIKGELKILEATKTELAKSTEFLQTHADFLRVAVEGEGIIKAVNTKLDIFEKRLDRIENQVNRSIDRTLTIIALIVMVITLGYAILKP